MTVVALLADPPREGDALPELVDAGVLSAAEAADLSAAAIQDAALTVARSGGDLLVNHPPAEEVPGDVDPEGRLRTLLDDVLEDLDDVRFEVQVGSTEAARVGNTVTHLLEQEGAASAAVLRPEAPLVDRSLVDGAAMKLRRDEVVLGPAQGGRVYYAGFTEPVDFEDALAEPEVATLARRGAAADLGVAFERMHPLLDTPDGLATVRALLAARRAADASVPPATAGVLADLDLPALESPEADA